MEEKIILKKDVDEAKKKADKLTAARNKAGALIEDAKRRYIKEKTRAKSKKAAEDKEAMLNSPHFAKLAEYDRREDIQEAYGWDMISGSERDKLEALWDEREAIKNNVVDGEYRDDVTEALSQAWVAVADLWEDEIFSARILEKTFNEQRIQAEVNAKEWEDRQNKAYLELMGGNT